MIIIMQQPNSSVFFVDFEAFQHGDEDFQLKEIAIMDAARPQRVIHFVYLPPYEWECLSEAQKATYSYERRKLHHLHWQEGTLHFCNECLLRELDRWFLKYADEDAVFYTMGQQKVAFLQKILPGFNVVNYAAVHNVTLKSLPLAPANMKCLYRNHGNHCAILKCYRLYLHFIAVNVSIRL